MLVSFDIKFIRQDQKQHRNGKACRALTENTMLVSFGIKFIRRDKKQRRNGKVCLASQVCLWLSLRNLISKDANMVYYLSCIISRFNGKKTAKQMKSRHSFIRTS